MIDTPVLTNADIKGLLIVNMFRKKLTDKVDADMQAVCKLQADETTKAQELFERISGRSFEEYCAFLSALPPAIEIESSEEGEV